MTVGAASTAGHCLCGAVRYEVQGAPNWVDHCHCDSCRRTCSAPFTTFFGVTDGNWRWTGVEPAIYSSSPGVTRMFCARCGSAMAYRSNRWPDEIHLYAASLENPAAVTPTRHVNWSEHLPWVRLADGLAVE
jgi:hypothetical protein